MIVADWKRDELYMLFSRRTNRKDKENYILNAIWHRLNNMDLQPVTQQCILLGDGNRALIDLYFPQIKYGIECDEEYHKSNTFADLQRTDNIEQALSAVSIDSDFTLKRIDATASLNDINTAITDTVIEIQERIADLEKPLIWRSVQEQIEAVIEKGVLSDSDLIPFPTQAAAGPCFGRCPKNWQKSYFSLNDEYQIWFPKLALEIDGNLKAQSYSGWINVLANDWSSIIEYNEKINGKGIDRHQKKKRVTFAKSKDVYGRNAYRFIGVFLHYETNQKGQRIYKRISNQIDLTQFRQ